MEFINTTGPAATQNTGLHCSLLHCIALSSVVFYFNAFCSVCCKSCDFLPPGYDSVKSESDLNLNIPEGSHLELKIAICPQRLTCSDETLQGDAMSV